MLSFFSPTGLRGRNIDHLIYIFLFFLSVFLLLPPVNSYSDLLWAEDGPIFATEAFSLGWKSIITPYAGYLHFYPRIVALVPTIFGIDAVPIIFLLGWFLSVGYALSIIFLALISRGVNYATAAMLCICVFILPNTGEIYFNLTNAQWFIGLGLCAYFIISEKPTFDWKVDIFFLPIAVLTGPFCMILLPFSLLKIGLISQNYKIWNWRILILAVGALVQLVYFLTSSRTVGELDTNIFHWLSAFDKFLTFGIINFGFGISVLIWIAIAYFFKNRYTENPELRKLGFLLLALAFSLFVVSLWSTKGAPNALSPVGAGSRYYFIPYSLILISWIIFLKQDGKILRIILKTLFVLSVFHTFSGNIMPAYFGSVKITKSPIDFIAFVHLNRRGEAVDIQLNPFWQMHPTPWRIHISIPPDPADLNPQPFRYVLSPKDVVEVNGQLDAKKGFTVDDSNSDPYIIFATPENCKEYDFFAIKAALRKETDGRVELFWQTETAVRFTPEHSRERFRPEGDSIVHFAIQNRNVTSFRIDPTKDTSKSTIQSIEVICYD